MGIDVCSVVHAVLGVTGGPEPHHKPKTTKEDFLAVMAQLRSLGDYGALRWFERSLSEACRRRHAIVTSSGTAALEAALMLVGVGIGSRVVVPTMSFAAAANAVSLRGAVPLFVEANFSDFGISITGLRNLCSTTRVDAIIAVHMLGHPCRISEVCDVADKWGIPVIEDAAEALGSVAGVRPCGSWGTVSVLSFNLNKVVTTGGGGALVLDDDKLADIATRLVTTSRVEHPWLVEHDAIAWNSRMPMLSAALGSSQIARLGRLVDAKRALASAYHHALHDIDGVMFHGEPLDTRSNYWLPTILVPDYRARDAVLTALTNASLGARAVFTPMHLLEAHKVDGDYPVAEEIWQRAVCLPAGIELAERFL